MEEAGVQIAPNEEMLFDEAAHDTEHYEQEQTLPDSRIMEMLAASRMQAESEYPQDGENLSEDELIKRENEELKQKLEEFKQIETERATEQFITAMQKDYPDFDGAVIAQQMYDYAMYMAEQFAAQGASPYKALRMAEYQTKMIWDNPQGIKNMYLLHKAHNAGMMPDMHISGSSHMPPKSWRDRLKSSDETERDSVFNELF